MTSNLNIEALLAEAQREVGRFEWGGTFADYLRMVSENPSVSRLSHRLIYDTIINEGVEETPTGEPIYTLFKDEIFGLDDALKSVVDYFASSSRRLEVRKRILLLLGPPASGKSSVVALIKAAVERYTRTNEGTLYAIEGCPMQEEPLHLIPAELRPQLMEDQGIYVEGDLCPRCRYALRTQYNGDISQVPITRVVFSEPAAIGIGYYVATNPNPLDASMLVGSIDDSLLQGDRLEVAGKAFRMDGEFNVANRGLMEFVEIFKADKHLLTTLLGLAQEQLVKMERFGSLYADEAIIAHSNEGDFNTFMADESSEALKDRIIAIRIPYNLRVRDEVKIYNKLLKSSGLENVHLPPLTLSTMSTFAILSRIEPPSKQGVSALEKLRGYDDQWVKRFQPSDVEREKRQHLREGMAGFISPRYVMNRLSSVASAPFIRCISPLKALDSLWRGLRENVSLANADRAAFIPFIKDTVEEYRKRAVEDVQRAFEERFEDTASVLLSDYLADVEAYCTGQAVRSSSTGAERRANERDMRELEKLIPVTERDRHSFREEIYKLHNQFKAREVDFAYDTEPRLKAGIEERLFPSRRRLERELSRPRFPRQRVEWARKRGAIYNRLVNYYGYCDQCADDTIEFAVHVVKNRQVVRSIKNAELDWRWTLDPNPTGYEVEDN